MNSLRTRLILAFAAVAVVPLVIAVAWLGQRLQATVRDEADARLHAALARIEARIDEERDRVAGRVAKLAADPEVRRLYLLGEPRRAELRELLDRQAPLLDLDVLVVLDREGRPVERASAPPRTRITWSRATAWAACSCSRSSGAGLDCREATIVAMPITQNSR